MKTPEQFVNEDCSVYGTSATVKAVAARDREVAEACALLVAEFSRPHWTASRHLDDRDDAEAHEAVAIALEDAAKNLRARFAAPSPETGTAAVPTDPLRSLTPEELVAFKPISDEQINDALARGARDRWQAEHPTMAAGPAPEPVKPPATCSGCGKPMSARATFCSDECWVKGARGTRP